MLKIGKRNTLPAIDERESGLLLDGGRHGDIFLPYRYVPDDYQMGDPLEVFVYWDSDQRLMATTELPYAEAGEFAWLKVVEINQVGAFLDWGMPKDLLLPYSEHKYQPEVGRRVMVRLFLDDRTDRLVATTRIEKYLREESTDFKAGQPVELLISDETELGFKAIVNHSHWGMLYGNQLFQNLHKGQRLNGFIQKIRKDKKIDLSLYPPGHEQIAEVAEKIIHRLNEHDGLLMLSDKSPPETIYSVFNVSKKVFKKAVGALYKQRRIVVEPNCIRLAEKD